MTENKFRATNFGNLTELVKNDDGNIISELAFFRSKGKPHNHNKWEHCYVTDGAGQIIVEYPYGAMEYPVKKGDVLHIPPLTDHYMIPDGALCLEILLVYSNTI